MELFYKYKLEENSNGYDVVLYIDDTLSEFSEELAYKTSATIKNYYKDIYTFVKEKYPSITINTVKIMIGGLLIVSFPFSNASAAVTTIANQPTTYVAKSGDTLWTISKNFSISIDTLKNVNTLKNENLSVGQKLVIPKAMVTTPAVTVKPTNIALAPASKKINYAVKSGDRLWDIARTFAVSLDSIRSANNLNTDDLSIGQNLIIPTTNVFTGDLKTNLNWIVDVQYNLTAAVFYDASSPNDWTKASKNQINYYANPANFSNNSYGKYQFLSLTYTPGINTQDINTLLKGRGVLSGKGDIFFKASAANNVSQVYLVSHALLETGNGSTSLAKGILVTKVDGKAVPPKIVYNMYAINALDSNPNKYGAEYAYKQKWFTMDDAIAGGAKWISSNYINNPIYKQNTLYKMRWNPDSPGAHQYSTDVAWAYKQTINMKRLLDMLPNAVLNFDIPKYNTALQVLYNPT